MTPLLFQFVLCAAAQQFGAIEVRFAPSDGAAVQEGVSLALKAPDGTVTHVPLHDDGVMPDDVAGDGLYCGGNWFNGDAAEGTLTVGKRTFAGGNITFPAGSELRILSVSTQGDKVVLSAAAPGPQGGEGPGKSGPEVPGKPPGGAGELGKGGIDPSSKAMLDAKLGKPLTAPGAEGGGVATWQNTSVRPTFRSSSSTSGVIMIVVALTGLVALAAAAGTVWMRRGGESAGRMRRWFGGGRPAAGLVPEPEPGLVGEATPSLSSGLSLWVVPAADAEPLVAPLLATLARRRRVLVVAPAQRAIPRVHGGPVYAAPALRPRQVREAIDTLLAESSGKITVLVLDPIPGALADLAAALPEGIGGVALVTTSEGLPALPRVDCHRDRDLWVVRHQDVEGRLAEGAGGLVAAG